MERLEKVIGYSFRNPELPRLAMTHSSYMHEQRLDAHNERLEFLGDSVLGFLSAEYFFSEYPGLPEGELTKKRAAAVCEGALCEYAKSIGLGEFLYLGKGEEACGGRERPSILSDAFEALLAAIFLDGGIEPAGSFVLRFLRDKRFGAMSAKDSKTLLQERAQRRAGFELEYVLLAQEGPAHDRRFTVAVMLNGRELGRGTEKSKKRAEQLAAAKALALIEAEEGGEN
jgi:ribonuclease-3